MCISDILTIFSIAVAAISIAYSSDRKIWFFKLSKFDGLIFVIWFIFANYLIFFDYFYVNGIYLSCFMKTEGFCLKPEIWSYIITIGFLAYMAYKVSFGKFPRNQYEKLTDYYATLIDSNFLLLANYLNENHSKAFAKYIQDFNTRIKKGQKKSSVNGYYFESDTEPNKTKNKKNKVPLVSLIYSKIIFTPAFIKNSISCRPLLFLSFVNELKYANIVNSKECVQLYYRKMIYERNAYLADGLNSTINYLGNNKNETAYRLTDSTFSRLTFENLKFTCQFEIWRAFGEEGLRDAATNNLFHQVENEWTDIQYNTTPARICLKFYDIFLRELICHYYESSDAKCEFIYLHYLYNICEGVWKGIVDAKVQSYALKFFNDLLSNMCRWLQCMKEYNCLQHEIDVLRIAENIIRIGDFPDEIKTEASSWLMKTFLELSKDKDAEDRDQLVENFFQVIKQLKDNETVIIKDGWEKLDKVKYYSYSYYLKLNNCIMGTS